MVPGFNRWLAALCSNSSAKLSFIMMFDGFRAAQSPPCIDVALNGNPAIEGKHTWDPQIPAGPA
jgi:hypothetical protein